MAQSGQLRELSTAAACWRSSCLDKSPRMRHGSGRLALGSCTRRENLSGGLGSGDDDNVDNCTRLTQPWVSFAGKKVLLSRSSYRRSYETLIPSVGDVTIQFGSFHNEKGKVTLIVAGRSPIPLILHWAFANMNNRAGSPWRVPAKQFW